MTRKPYVPPQVLDVEPGELTDELMAKLEQSGMRRIKCEGCGCDLLTRGTSNKCPPCDARLPKPDPVLDLLTSPKMMNAIARHVFGRAQEITGQAEAEPELLCVCLECGQPEPIDPLAHRVIRELSSALEPREIAEVVVLVCSCGGQGCICPECVEIAHGRELGASTQPCPNLAKLGKPPRKRGPEA